MPFIVVEQDGYEGVRRIAGKIAEDIRNVTGECPPVITGEELKAGRQESVILCVTAGRSGLLEELKDRGLVDISGLYKEPEEKAFGWRSSR